MTTENYDETLAEAYEILNARVPVEGWPEGEREKAMNDALDNVWGEGMTVEEWAAAAAVLLSQ